MLNLELSCRTCMKQCENLVHLNNFVKIENFDLELVQILTECTNAQFSEDDALPKKLCDECVNIIQLFYKFRLEVVKNEEKFKKLLETNYIKTEIEILPKTESIEAEAVDADKDYIIDSGDFFSYHGDSLDDYITDEINENLKYNVSQKGFKEKEFNKCLESNNADKIPTYACPICQKIYYKKSLLDKHLVKHCKLLKCEICNLTFESEKLLLEHTEIHIKTENEQQENKFQCPDCELSFPKQRSLSMHKKKHKAKCEGKKTFICDVCGKCFSIKTMLRRHVKLHSNVKPFKCTKCPKSYSRQDQFREHMNKHDANKRNVCSYCNKGFSQISGLKEHIRTHTGETPFLCSECGKGFTNSSNLRQHMLRHSGIKAFACNLCPKTFCTKGQMTAHVATHTEAHPYRCEVCCAAFTKPNSLKKHSLIHLGLRPFACDTCNKRFTSKDHLKRHNRTHTGEKPYKCQHCERAFAQSNDLVKHTRVHVGLNTYGCTICDMKFRLMSELKRHYPVHFANGQVPDFQEHQHLPSADLKLATNDKKIAGERVDKKDGKVTITINSCDKNGVVGDITINIV